jgi:hypothetical protein
MRKVTASEACVAERVAPRVDSLFGTMGIGLGGAQDANPLPGFQAFTRYPGHLDKQHQGCV